MKKNLIFGTLASCVLLLSSCLSDGESNGTLSGYFTISNTLNQTVLFLDGGGTVYPTSQSVSNITDGKGFGSYKRVFLYMTYPESGLNQNADGSFVVRDAELQGGTGIILSRPISTEEAEAKNVLATDSLYTLSNPSKFGLWIYNGYITTTYSTVYYSRDNKGLLPSMNIVYDPIVTENKEINIKLALNLHKQDEKDILINNPNDFAVSFDAAVLASHFPPAGIDSIKINYEGLGLPKKSFKIATKELSHYLN